MTHDTSVMQVLGSFQRFTATWVDRRTGVQGEKTMYAPDAEEAAWSVRGTLRDKCTLSGRVYRSADYDVAVTPAGMEG